MVLVKVSVAGLIRYTPSGKDAAAYNNPPGVSANPTSEIPLVVPVSSIPDTVKALVLINATPRSVFSPLTTPTARQISDPSGVTAIEPWEKGVAPVIDTVVTIALLEVSTTSTHVVSFGPHWSPTYAKAPLGLMATAEGLVTPATGPTTVFVAVAIISRSTAPANGLCRRRTRAPAPRCSRVGAGSPSNSVTYTYAPSGVIAS